MFWNRKPIFLVTIHLKSGTTVNLRCHEFSAFKTEEKLTKISWKLTNPSNTFLYIDVENISAIVSEKA